MHCSNRKIKTNEKKRQSICIWCCKIKWSLYLQWFHWLIHCLDFLPNKLCWVDPELSYHQCHHLKHNPNQISPSFPYCEVELQDFRICLCLQSRIKWWQRCTRRYPYPYFPAEATGRQKSRIYSVLSHTVSTSTARNILWASRLQNSDIKQLFLFHQDFLQLLSASGWRSQLFFLFKSPLAAASPEAVPHCRQEHWSCYSNSLISQPRHLCWLAKQASEMYKLVAFPTGLGIRRMVSHRLVFLFFGLGY